MFALRQNVLRDELNSEQASSQSGQPAGQGNHNKSHEFKWIVWKSIEILFNYRCVNSRFLKSRRFVLSKVAAAL